MEEAIAEALRAAGDSLAEAMRRGLEQRGLPGEVQVRHAPGCSVVASTSPAVRAAALGCPGRAPEAVMEQIAGEARPAILDVLRNRIEGVLR